MILRAIVTKNLALFLAILSVLGVLAFHFPAYLTTPELRSFYTVEAMRTLLFAALLASGTIALTNIVFGRQRWLNIAAFVLVCCAVAAGGSGKPLTYEYILWDEFGYARAARPPYRSSRCAARAAASAEVETRSTMSLHERIGWSLTATMLSPAKKPAWAARSPGITVSITGGM